MKSVKIHFGGKHQGIHFNVFKGPNHKFQGYLISHMLNTINDLNLNVFDSVLLTVLLQQEKGVHCQWCSCRGAGGRAIAPPPPPQLHPGIEKVYIFLCDDQCEKLFLARKSDIFIFLPPPWKIS